MKTPLTYGFIITLCSSLLSLGFFFTGFHDTAAKAETAQNISMALGIVIAATCMILGMREKRALTPADAKWGYGSALGTGVLIGIFAAVLGAVYTYAYFEFIHPQMNDVILQMQLDKMVAKGMSADQIDRAEPYIRKWMNPVMLTAWSFIMIFLFNIVLAFICAIFIKNRPAQEAANAT